MEVFAFVAECCVIAVVVALANWSETRRPRD
jgi:hypothetical protein